MLILNLIKIILAAGAIYYLVQRFNTYTMEKTRYRFFTIEHTIGMVISYAMIYFGHYWFEYALKNKEDILNGKLVMILGLALLLGVLQNNFKKVPLKYALMGSAMQLALYIPITIGAVFIVAGLFAFFARTQPVFNINARE